MKYTLAIECPKCRALLYGHTHIVGRKHPAKGDLVVCLYCTTMLRYSEIDNKLALEILTTPEFQDLPTETQQSLNNIVKAIVDTRHKEKGGNNA